MSIKGRVRPILEVRRLRWCWYGDTHRLQEGYLGGWIMDMEIPIRYAMGIFESVIQHESEINPAEPTHLLGSC